MAKSCEPSPLKSPVTKSGSRDGSGAALFSNTRATAVFISAGLGGSGDGFEAGEGLACASKGLKTGAAAVAGVGSGDADVCGASGCFAELAHDEKRQTATRRIMPEPIILRRMTTPD